MIGYKQFLLENSEPIVATGREKPIDGIRIDSGDVYYLDAEGHLHRDGGPALVAKDVFWAWMNHGKHHRIDGPATQYNSNQYQWWIEDRRIEPVARGYDKRTSNEDMWALLKGSIPNNLEILNQLHMTKEMQEYICQHRPDLIGQIQNLDPELKKHYEHEQKLTKVDI